MISILWIISFYKVIDEIQFWYFVSTYICNDKKSNCTAWGRSYCDFALCKYKTSCKYDCSQCGCGILSSLYFLKNSFQFHSFGSYLRDDANKVLDTNIFFHCTCRPYHIFCAYNDSKDIVVYFVYRYDIFNIDTFKSYQNYIDIENIKNKSYKRRKNKKDLNSI